MEPPTPEERQELCRLLKYIQDFRRKHDCGPAYRDLGPVIDRSASTVMSKVEVLLANGLASGSRINGRVVRGSLNLTDDGLRFIEQWENDHGTEPANA